LDIIRIKDIKEADRYNIQRRKYKRFNIKELKSKLESLYINGKFMK